MDVNASDLGTIQMLPYHLPVMPAGKYEITVQHALSLDKESDTFTTTQAFEVTGSGYDVEQDIVQLFPAHNGVGKFFNLLPQIVLNNKSLPWEKDNLFQDGTKRKNEPWIGLLLFREGEDFVILTDKDLIDATKDRRFKPKDTTFLPSLNLKEDLVVVDIDLNLFLTIAPTTEDLALLAHIREELPAASQSAFYLQTLKDIATDSESPKYSIVACNRLPQKGKMHTACLVSFEYWGEILNSRNISNEDKFQQVRLRVLKHWTFADNTEDVTFSSYLKKMNTDAKGQPLENLSFKLPSLAGHSSAIDAANKAFDLGFVPLQHHLRNGDKTISFYRGPLIPYDNTADNKMDAKEIKGTDSSIRYNSQTAMFNESYAAAYQLGKLLALGSQTVAQAIMNYRTQTKQQLVLENHKNEIKTQLLPAQGSTQADSLNAFLSSINAELSSISLDQLVQFHLKEAITILAKSSNNNHE